MCQDKRDVDKNGVALSLDLDAGWWTTFKRFDQSKAADGETKEKKSNNVNLGPGLGFRTGL